MNNTTESIHLKRNDHFCQICQTIDINATEQIIVDSRNKLHSTTINVSISSLSAISVDPNKQLSPMWISNFQSLHTKYSSVFESVIGRYNDNSGKVRARVNIGTATPPTKKLKVPQYSRSNLLELQEKFDDLERQGVFARPEDLDIAVEHVSPSFLIKKPSGGTRLVTAFTSIGPYSKILPSIMPSVDGTLRTIANWKFIAITDLKDSFYQIPLERESMKWCATPTPFRGLRLYTVSTQGMPGSSETLEEMMSTVLGQLIQER